MQDTTYLISWVRFRGLEIDCWRLKCMVLMPVVATLESVERMEGRRSARRMVDLMGCVSTSLI